MGLVFQLYHVIPREELFVFSKCLRNKDLRGEYRHEEKKIFDNNDIISDANGL